MNQEYHDITSRLGKPLWFDECGVPRYDPFTPRLCNDIYTDEAVLLEIACQGCYERFKVAMSRNQLERLRIAHARGESLVPAAKGEAYTLRDEIKDRTIHYGDPPHHDDPARCILAKCPADLESNGWYARMGFVLRTRETTRTGKWLNVWEFSL